MSDLRTDPPDPGKPRRVDSDAPTSDSLAPMSAPWSETGLTSLSLTREHLDQMIAHCLRSYPEEGCGLLTGDLVTYTVAKVQPTTNIAASAQLYTVDPREHLIIDREAESEGQSVIGVFHSHTHTDPYPSATDVAQAPDPSWHYVLVSLRHEVASVRSYRVVGGQIVEEAIEVH